MKKKYLFLLVLINISVFSQIRFEEGYFINNEGERVDGFIKNVDWRSNPDTFEYRMNQIDKPIKLTVHDVEMFQVLNEPKYIRKIVLIDQSSHNIKHLSESAKPDYKEETVFLKELLPGPVSLLLYSDSGTNLFFYQLSDGEVKNLIYKPYSVDETTIAYNEDYKNQLKSVLSCASIDDSDFQKLKYQEKYLRNIFTQYYQCSDPDYSETTKVKKGKFNFNVRPRVNLQHITVTDYFTDTEFKLGNKAGIGLGLEGEYILPFNRNKWALLAEIVYQRYKSEINAPYKGVSGGEFIINAIYNMVDIPLGLRHYFFLGDQSKVFVNLQYVLGLSLDSELVFSRKDGSIYSSYLFQRLNPNFAVGAGYSYNKKWGIEARYNGKRWLTPTYKIADYENVSFIFSYNLL